MAIPHFELKRISRTDGGSATAAAAYRSGTSITDERTGIVHDYARRTGVVASEVLLPEGAAEEFHDRDVLWNAAERSERRKDSCVAREIVAGLPRELDRETNWELARSFAQRVLVEGEGIAVDVALHNGTARDGGEQPHVHLLLSTRVITPEGFAKKKHIGLDKDTTLRAWRSAWEEHVNAYLDESGSDARIDLRSLKDQGIDRKPEPKIGAEACALEKKGIDTRRGNQWREVQHSNHLLAYAQPVTSESLKAEEEQLSQAQMRTHSLLELSRSAYTGRRA